MKTVYVGFKFGHMGSHSGYDLIRSHAGYDVVIDCQAQQERLRRFLDSGTLVARLYARLFGTRLWWVEWRCLMLALREREVAFHFVYAENCYRYLGWFKWLGFRIVPTYHQPPAFFDAHPPFRRGISQADDVIVLSPTAVREFVELKGDERVHYVPHGVDTAYFRPDGALPGREVLMVGNWLRNFAFADRVFARLVEADPEVTVHVVASRENLARLRAHPRIRRHNGITDDELLALYRRAALLFLPLDGFVANNAVLEAAAVGCPIVVASDQVESVLPETVVERVPLSEDRALETILERLHRPDPGRDMRRAWVVEHVGWETIGARTREILCGAGAEPSSHGSERR